MEVKTYKESWNSLFDEQIKNIWSIFHESKGKSIKERFKLIVDKSPVKKQKNGEIRMIYEWSTEKNGKKVEIEVVPSRIFFEPTFSVYFLIGCRAKWLTFNVEELFKEGENWFKGSLNHEFQDLLLKVKKEDEDE